MKLLHSFIAIIPLVSAGSVSSKKSEYVDAVTIEEIPEYLQFREDQMRTNVAVGVKKTESGTFEARVRLNSCTIYLGTFSSENQAAQAINFECNKRGIALKNPKAGLPLKKPERKRQTDSISIDDQNQEQNSILNLTPSFGSFRSFEDYNNINQSFTETEINTKMRMTELAEKLSNMEIANLEYKNKNNTLLENYNLLNDQAAKYKHRMEQLEKQLNEKQTKNYETADDSCDLEEEKNVQMKIQLEALQAKISDVNCDNIQVEEKNNILNLENDNFLKQIEILEEKLENNIINTIKNENLNEENIDLEETCEIYRQALQKKDGEMENMEMEIEHLRENYIKSEEEKNILHEDLKKALRNEEESENEELRQDKISKHFSCHL